MRATILLTLLVLISTSGCGPRQTYHKPNDPLEAGRDFIRFALDGNMEQARQFILPGPDNERLFNKIVADYEKSNDDAKASYKEASIIVNKVENLDDSTTIINFANSYKKKNSEIKLVKLNGEWWVDFKYTFTGNLPIE